MIELRAGNLRMQYDQGFLRYIKLGDYEVLRMIYFALRDHNWDTMSGYLENEIIRITEKSFQISYRWISSESQFPFVWDVKIQGKENMEVTFSIKGKALKDVRKNRSGFCVLHSIKENAGCPCTITNPSGDRETGLFPKYISPHQPFFDIKKMTWPLAKKGRAILFFKGDVFETEDQRNWSDDSYKTYCTPLAIPFPALLKKNEEVFQEVKLEVEPFEMTDALATEEICVLLPKLAIPDRPRIGIGAPSDGYIMSPSEIGKIRNLGFDHYHLEVDFSRDDWHSFWQYRTREALALQQDLEVFLIFSDNYLKEADLFANELDHLPADVKTDLLILHLEHKTTPDFLLEAVIPILRQVRKNARIGAGTAAYFTELNRERVKPQGLDFVSYSVNPQVHAFDNASLSENAQAQFYTVESARKYFNDLPVHISPITLKPRFNPNATTPGPENGTHLPEAVDPRQASLYGACWTLSSLVHLCASGADLLTYFETVGWKGIMQGSREPKHPDLFAVKRDMFFPVFHIFQCLLKHKTTSWLPFDASMPYTVVALGFREGSSSKILMANLFDKVIDTHLKYPCTKYRFFIWGQDNLSDSYVDMQFLDRNLESISFRNEVFPRIKIGSHAIVYAELLD